MSLRNLLRHIGRAINIKRVLLLFAPFLILDVVYFFTLIYPTPFFMYSLKAHHIEIYSDKPIPAEASNVLEDTYLRISRSNMYNPTVHHRVFISNDKHRFWYFTRGGETLAGQNYVYLNNNIFLRSSDFTNNRLIDSAGHPVPGDRTLSYYLSHEITHSMTIAEIGRINYFSTPNWLKEGYAEYVARGPIDSDSLSILLGSSRTHESDYLKYYALVAYALDIKKVALADLMSGKFDESSLAEEIETSDFIAGK